MRAWVEVIRATISAEWPEFEITSSFAAFSLKTDGRSHGPSNEQRRTMLERLARAFLEAAEGDEDLMHHGNLQVWRQFTLCWPYASKIVGTQTESAQRDFLCWNESVKRAAQNGHDVRSLKTLVNAGLASTGAGTSNSERDFAAIRRRVNQPLIAEAERSLDGFLARVKKTSSGLDKKKALCEAARKIWASGFDRPRLSGNERKFPNWKGASSKAKARLSPKINFLFKFRPLNVDKLLMCPQLPIQLTGLQLGTCVHPAASGKGFQGHGN